MLIEQYGEQIAWSLYYPDIDVFLLGSIMIVDFYSIRVKLLKAPQYEQDK